jgi:DNA-binding response OmpR family regulator
MEKIKKVLIVEDEESLMGAVSQKFKDQPFEVLKAVDGSEALRIALEAHPDLILLDIVMPKIDGLSMLKSLREDDWGKGAKVIMLTNLNSSDKMNEAKKLNVNDYLVKTDCKIEDILNKVLEELNN